MWDLEDVETPAAARRLLDRQAKLRAADARSEIRRSRDDMPSDMALMDEFLQAAERGDTTAVIALIHSGVDVNAHKTRPLNGPLVGDQEW